MKLKSILQSMDGWKDISTAPKDGKLIVVGSKEDADDLIQEAYVMRWSHIARNSFFAPGKVGMWVDPHISSLTWSDQDGCGPTHWHEYEG